MRIKMAGSPSGSAVWPLGALLIRVVLIATALAAVLAALVATIVIVVPVLIFAGLALHLYVRRRLSRARQQPRPFDREERASGRGDVIEVEYRVVDRP